MSTSPSGTVTFLLTDIEGSTARWEHERDRMAAALTRHNQILREAIEAHGGVFFKLVGDQFQAAFATAIDACAAAVAAQRRIAAEPWEAAAPLRVRMALHTGAGLPIGAGETTNLASPALQALARIQAGLPHDGDYLAPVLNRLSRLLSAGHGGQVLLTRATRELVRDGLPPDIRLRDLGVHRLRDLVEPEHIYQVEADGLPADIPPLKVRERRVALPPQQTLFVGREGEVARLCALIEERTARLLTLTGPGGTGKTRLAIEVASRTSETFADGVAFVDLSTVATPAQVPAAVRRALELREPEGNQPEIEQLVEHLRERDLLLLLDNFEHLTPAKSVVKDLLTACPALSVIVTSRAPLALYGEQAVAIPPLELPDPRQAADVDDLARNDAVRLFVQRAQAVKAGFALAAENADDVVHICHRLDGLPLAIELAAARVKLLPPRALRGRLERRLKLLTNDVADRPERQQTLRATIDWSHDLLSAEEQRLFRRLAVLVGGGGLEAAEALAAAGEGDELDALEVLASLVDKSLVLQSVDADGEPRYRMLETVREYALERLTESGDEDPVRERHAAIFHELAGQGASSFGGPDQGAWLDRVEREHDNLRAALGWLRDRGARETYLEFAISLWRFWNIRGYLGEGRAWLSPAADDDPALPAATRARALLALGVLVRNQGQYRHARELADQALALFEAAGDASGIAHALNDLAAVAQELGERDYANQLLERSLALFREAGDREGIASALTNRGCDAWEQGDLSLAAHCFAESLAEYRRLGHQRGQAVALGNLGEVAHSRGDYREAKALYQESLAIRRQLGDKRGMAIVLGNLVTLLAECGDATPETFRLGEESLALYEEIGDREGIACTLCALGQAAHHQGDHDRALGWYQRSLALFEELDDPSGVSEALSGMAAVSLDGEQDARAAELLGRALSLLATLDDEAGLARALELAGRLAARHDRLELAARLFGAASRLREAIEVTAPPVQQARVSGAVETVRARLGEPAFKPAFDQGRAAPAEEVIGDAIALVDGVGGAAARFAGADALLVAARGTGWAGSAAEAAPRES